MSDIPTEPRLLDKIVVLLVNGLSDAAAENAAVEKLGMTPAAAADAIQEGRRRITVSADYKRDEQVGTAILRLNDLYTRAIKVQDVKSALAAQKELNRLLSLYPQETRPEDETCNQATAEAVRDLGAVRAHLVGLGLATPDTPTVELARLAAGRLLMDAGDDP